MSGRAANARQGVVDAAVGLQAALDGFLALREQALERLAEQQASMLTVLGIGALVLGLVLVIGTLMFARFLHRRLTVPLNDIAYAAMQLEAGDLAVRVRAHYDDEFGDRVQFLGIDRPIQMVQLTSPKPGDGKTHKAYIWSYCTTSANPTKGAARIHSKRYDDSR